VHWRLKLDLRRGSADSGRMASPKLVPVVISDGERRTLEELRARIVLTCAGRLWSWWWLRT
jgi:hypothetical protein